MHTTQMIGSARHTQIYMNAEIRTKPAATFPAISKPLEMTGTNLLPIACRLIRRAGRTHQNTSLPMLPS